MEIIHENDNEGEFGLYCFLVLATCSLASAHTSGAKGVPCDGQKTRKGWQAYVNRIHGFCIRYHPSTNAFRKGLGMILSHSSFYVPTLDSLFRLTTSLSTCRVSSRGPRPVTTLHRSQFKLLNTLSITTALEAEECLIPTSTSSICGAGFFTSRSTVHTLTTKLLLRKLRDANPKS